MQKLTKEQAIVLTGFTGICMVSFSDFHEDVEKRLGRPILTHEFIELMETEVKEAYRADFLSMLGGEDA